MEIQLFPFGQMKLPEDIIKGGFKLIAFSKNVKEYEGSQECIQVSRENQPVSIRKESKRERGREGGRKEGRKEGRKSHGPFGHVCAWGKTAG